MIPNKLLSFIYKTDFVANVTEFYVINSIKGEINHRRNHHKQSEFKNYVYPTTSKSVNDASSSNG